MKVFLSSTYLDLIEYRKEAAEALARLGHHVIGMETFNARTEDPTKASLREVEECELFVGIYAHRYGTLISSSKISVTEQEFDHAVKTSKEIFAFYVDDDYPWPPKVIDKDVEQIKKLKDFKIKIVSHVVPDYFTDKKDLAYKIVSAVKSHFARTDYRVPTPEPRRPIGSTLPSQPYFFGREKELAIIADAISPESRTWGALIDGPGGIGKTALAIRAAHLAPTTLFERKIFITAKVRELTPEGEKPLKDFSRDNYFSMLNELALELGEEGIPRLAPDERANPLRMAMVGKKTLIVFDNLETLSEDERTRLFQFLSRLPEGNKAIVTSRRRADVDARVIRLDRLSANEALQLMEELAKNNSRLAREIEKARRDLYEITNGNPLLIKWVCGQLGRDGSAMHTIAEACKFIENAPKGNDPLEYIFGDLLDTFTESETKVLAALTHFTQPAKIKWIIDMTEIAEKATETTLEDLNDRSILNTTNDRREFFLPPLASQFIRKRYPEVANDVGGRLAMRTAMLALQYGGFDNYKGFQVLDTEWQFIISALPLLLIGDNAIVQIICSSLFRFYEFTGRWDEFLSLCEQAEQKALTNDDKKSAGWRAYQAGYTYYLRNQPERILECASRAEKYWKNAGVEEKSSAYQLRGLGHTLEKNYPAAIAAHKKAITMIKTIEPESSDYAAELNWLAGAEANAGKYKAAEKDQREALRIAVKTGDKELIVVCTDRLAELALDREQWKKAEELSRKALKRAKSIGRQELVGSASLNLGIALFNQNEFKKALPYARSAVEIYSYLHVQNSFKTAEDLLAAIEAETQTNSNKRTRKTKSEN